MKMDSKWEWSLQAWPRWLLSKYIRHIHELSSYLEEEGSRQKLTTSAGPWGRSRLGIFKDQRGGQYGYDRTRKDSSSQGHRDNWIRAKGRAGKGLTDHYLVCSICHYFMTYCGLCEYRQCNTEALAAARISSPTLNETEGSGKETDMTWLLFFLNFFTWLILIISTAVAAGWKL